MRFSYTSGSSPLEGYTIKRGIGVGGFGEVYFALSDAGKEVALKRIQRNLDIELRGVRQCLNLKHVNLISLWDIRTCDKGESWVVMEYVPGHSLRDEIESHPAGMPLSEVHRWFQSAAAGVSYLHDRGIVHRDLKPGNIFYDEDQHVIKIGDYGLSKFISCSRRDGQTESVGTFHYMAPEIGKGIYGKEIDIYAMGIILFEMLTGRVPYEGESSQEIIMKHLTADPDVDELAPEYRQLICRALAKDPHGRFTSVEEMITEMPVLNDHGALQRKPNHAAVPSKASQGTPPIQPMFIGEEPMYIGEEMVMGEVQPVVQASAVEPDVLVQSVTIRSENVAAVPEEPIAKAVRSGWGNLVQWWQDAKISTPIKILIMIVLGLIVLANVQWLLPMALGLGLVYLVYYAIRTWTVQPKPTRSPVVSQQPSPAQMRRMARGWLAGRPFADRAGELIGSLLLSAFACGVFCFLALLLAGDAGQWTLQSGAFFTWLFVTCVSASWSLLLLGKLWEHRDGEQVLRRFAMLPLGLAVGSISFVLANSLHVDWSNASTYQMEDLEFSPFEQSVFNAGFAPNMIAYLVFFAGLFVILRWWRQADPTRRTRLSIWSVGLCLIWAVILGQLFYFPQPWSMVVAVVVALSTQLAAPWLNPSRRMQIAHGDA